MIIRSWNEQTPKTKRLTIVGIGVIAIVVLISYYPALKVGFLGDDWWFLAQAAKLNLFDYLAFYFDPAKQIFWYRPLYGIMLLFEYLFFGSAPEGYHLIQVLLHFVNCLLLFALIRQVSRRWRLGLIVALLYAVLPVYSLAVSWIAVQDPLAMVFFLTAILFWVNYLQNGQRRFYLLTFAAVLLALLGKETNFFLPLLLFLLSWWFPEKPVSKTALLCQFVPFGLILLFYLAIERQVQTNAYFTNHWGYGIGFHVIENGARYLALLAFPWDLPAPFNYIVLLVEAVILTIIGLKQQGKLLLFLGITMLLAIAPAVAFPTFFFYPRYLYMAAMVSSILMALLVEKIWTLSMPRFSVHLFILTGITLLLLSNSSGTFAMAEAAAEEGRQFRVPLRDIYQQHPTYPVDTYLYFIEPPYPMIMRNLTGMFMLRYGTNVSVWSNDAEWGGDEQDRFANLRDHDNSFVYYFDASGQRHEVRVDPHDSSIATPALPVRFQSSVGLDGYEVTSSRVKSGADLILLLYWQTSAPIDRDYTVFVHLVDENGATVFGEDSQPRGGRAPTTTWQSGKLVVDAHIVTMTKIPPGKYRLAVGMYDLSTQTPLSLIDENGAPVTQQVIIVPIEVVE